MAKSLILYSLLSFLISLIFAGIVSRYGSKVGLIDAPNKRSSHTVPTPKGGGIGLLLAFILTGVFVTQHQAFTILAGIVGFVSLLEDRISIPEKLRLVLQLVVSSIVVSLFTGMPASIIAALLFLFWIIFITGTANFYNFMDGIDGIAGLTGFIGYGFMAVFSFFLVEKSGVAMISTALSVGCLGFLPFNFPKARVFLGDVGSVLLGFVFASFVIKLSTSISEFLCIIMFLCMFYADSLVTIFCRLQRGDNIIMAHRRHLYQYMCNELKIPHWKVSLSYASTQFVFAVLALFAYKKGIVWQIVVFVFFVVMFLIIYRIIKNIKPTTYTLQM
jgi:Fuc2NAc and GlcNAc transferase